MLDLWHHFDLKGRRACVRTHGRVDGLDDVAPRTLALAFALPVEALLVRCLERTLPLDVAEACFYEIFVIADLSSSPCC